MVSIFKKNLNIIIRNYLITLFFNLEITISSAHYTANPKRKCFKKNVDCVNLTPIFYARENILD